MDDERQDVCNEMVQSRELTRVSHGVLGLVIGAVRIGSVVLSVVSALSGGLQ